MRNKTLTDQSTLKTAENRAKALPDFWAISLLPLPDQASTTYGIGDEEQAQTRGNSHDEY